MSMVPLRARISPFWTSCLISALLPAGLALAQCTHPYDFEDPPYTGSAAGTLVTGQPAVCPAADQWFIPVAGSLDNFAYTYAGNALAFPANPQGALQYVGAVGPLARAQHNIDLSGGTGVWKLEYDFIGKWDGTVALPAADNVGSFSLQPSATARFFQTLMNWGAQPATAYEGPNSPPPNNTAAGTNYHLHFGHTTAAAPTLTVFSVPGPDFLNLDSTHWYRVAIIWDFNAAQILRVSITDLTAATPTITADVYSLGWYLFGGPHSTNPLPTAFRLFTGSQGNATGWDNVAFTQLSTADLGACCDTITGLCGFAFPTDCADATHTFGGVGTDCTTAPCVAVTAACCDPSGGCTVTTLANCAPGNLWRGAGSNCAQCVADCQPAPAAACQSRGNLDAYLSDFTTAVASENFIPSANSITGGCVSGVYSTLFPPLPVSQFRVKYYGNSSTGIPGSLIASFEEGVNLTVAGPAATPGALPTGEPVLSWTFSHAPVAVTPGACHWIEISNETTRPWYWDTSGDGEGYFMQDATPATPYGAGDIVGLTSTNLAFCIDNAAHNQTLNLAGLTGCVVGSCCFNQCPFTCLSNVSQSACTASATAAGGTATWTAGGSCLTSCSQPPTFCCRGDMTGNFIVDGRDIQMLAQALLSPGACAVDPAAFCRLNVNEDFLVNVNATPSPNDIQAMVSMLVSGGESPDRICGAVQVSSNSVTTLDNTNATTSVFDPDLLLCNPVFPAGFKGEGSMWLRFVATHTTATVDTELTGLTPIPPQVVVDSILTVYFSSDGTPGTALFGEIACDDDSGTGTLSLINLTNLTIGGVYYIELMDYPGQGSRGIYTVRVTSP